MAASYGLGEYQIQRMKANMTEMEEFYRMYVEMEILCDQIRLPYRQVLQVLQKDRPKYLKNILNDALQQMELYTDEGMESIWEKAICRELSNKTNHLELYKQIANSFGMEDAKGSVGRYYLWKLENLIKETQKEQKGKYKLYRATAMFLGITIITFFL